MVNLLELEYARKTMLAHEALELLRDDEKVAFGMAAAQPPALMNALRDLLLWGRLDNVHVYYQHGSDAIADTLLQPDLQDLVRCYCLFMSSHDRREQEQVEFIPCHFHQSAKLLLNDIGITTLLTTVSPMNEEGFFSFGTNADYVITLAQSKNVNVVVEVNKFMPFVQSEFKLHISQVKAIVENDQPLLQAHPRHVTEKDRLIARHIAEHIQDGSTIQLGIGGVPVAVAELLTDRNDLGIHTELLSPALVDLIRNGNVTGRAKTLLPCRHVFTLALGDQEMYDYLRVNQQITGYPVSWTNNPAIIAQNNQMISVNAAVEVDLFGQVNAEWINGRHWSGSGGQLDFVRGAYASVGGKSLIALNSTAKRDAISKIVAPNTLTCVTDPRTDVHFVVTEYGAVNLKGCSMRERMRRLISIAHPKFRTELDQQAALFDC